MRIFLLADIGGTFIRFCLYKNGKLSTITKMKCDEFKTPEMAIKAYLDTINDKPTDMIFAVAGSIYQGSVLLTNRSWKLSEAKLKKQFNLKSCLLINDFAAKGYSVLDISKKEMVSLGKGRSEKNTPLCVIGPGTGLGISFVLPKEQTVWDSEGGHVDMAAHTPTEQRILEYLSNKDLTVSAEEVLSGRGLIGIYQALHAIEGIQLPKAILAEDLPWLVEKKDEMAIRTYQYFLTFLAHFAGNMAITMKTTGGVYFLSNLLKPPFVQKQMQKAFFRKTFESRGKMTALAKKIPTYLVIREHSAFIGLKKLAKKLLEQTKK